MSEPLSQTSQIKHVFFCRVCVLEKKIREIELLGNSSIFDKRGQFVACNKDSQEEVKTSHHPLMKSVSSEK